MYNNGPYPPNNQPGSYPAPNNNYPQGPSQSSSNYQYGMYPPPPPTPGQFVYPPQPPPNKPSRPYSSAILFVMLGAYITAGIFIFVGAAYSSYPVAVFLGNLGISLFWGVLVSVLIIDWRGYTSLNGWIQWSKIQGEKR